jgi:hypothetical protein
MKTTLLVSGLALSAGIASSAHAGFTGFTVESMGTIGGRDVYRVFANFDDASNVILNTLKHTVTAGTMNALHNDSDSNDEGPGSWSPSFTSGSAQRANDSYVTITGLTGGSASTNLDPGFLTGLGSQIPNGAGWFDSNPTNPIVVGSTLRVLVIQVAVASGSAGYTASLGVGYKANSTATEPIFGSGSYTIPAPGVLALLGAAGLIGRRRRA